MKILAIDDSLSDRVLLKSVIEHALAPDDTMFVAENGEQGLTIIRNKPVDLVVTDLLMPGLSGIDVLVQAKQLQPLIEVVVITASQSIESAVVAMKKGARDYLTKPINAAVLLEKINNIRDYLNRVHEADDYRFAKERMEDAATQTIQRLERCCGRTEKIVTDVNAIIRDEGTRDSEKVVQIERLMVAWQKQCAEGR